MKIIYLHQYFNTPDMKGGTRSYEMARRLVAAGHEVHIVTSWRKQSKNRGWCESLVKGVYVHWLAVPYSNHMGYIRRIWAFFYFAIFAARKATQLGGDIVFATSTPLTIALPAVYAARKNNLPMVFEVRDLWPEIPIAIGALRNPIFKYIAKKLELFAYENAAHIVALSPGMKEGIAKTGYPEKQISIIPNSADLDLFNRNKKAGNSFRSTLTNLNNRRLILYAGTFGHINGLSYMVHMAKSAQDHQLDLFFVAIGDGIEKDNITALAYELNVYGTYFEILPPIPKKAMAAALEAADIACSFVINIPSLWMNSANKFFDGLASGTPVAINYNGWQADILRRTHSGIVLPPDRPEKGALLLSHFISNDLLYKEAAANARTLAEIEFSRDKLAAQLEKILIETYNK